MPLQAPRRTLGLQEVPCSNPAPALPITQFPFFISGANLAKFHINFLQVSSLPCTKEHGGHCPSPSGSPLGAQRWPEEEGKKEGRVGDEAPVPLRMFPAIQET